MPRARLNRRQRRCLQNIEGNLTLLLAKSNKFAAINQPFDILSSGLDCDVFEGTICVKSLLVQASQAGDKRDTVPLLRNHPFIFILRQEFERLKCLFVRNIANFGVNEWASQSSLARETEAAVEPRLEAAALPALLVAAVVAVAVTLLFIIVLSVQEHQHIRHDAGIIVFQVYHIFDHFPLEFSAAQSKGAWGSLP